MDLLVFGGTAFLGRAIVEHALERNHTLTLFNRGRTNPGLFPDVEQIHGDRATDLERLAGRRWDAVIDVNGMISPHVQRAAALLRPHVDHYTFISTISVYADPAPPHISEDAPVATMEGDAATERADDMQTYGARKARCEDAVRASFADQALIVRPGLIIGPYDYTDRFTYWARRIAQGGEVLVPNRPDQPVQLIDAADLGRWIVQAVERKLGGTFNATGPQQPISFATMVETCRSASNSSAEFTWVTEPFLREHNVAPFRDLPFWLPADDGFDGIMQVDCTRAQAAGLTYTPLATTIQAILAHDQQRQEPLQPQRGPVGLSSAREAELLRAWHSREQ